MLDKNKIDSYWESRAVITDPRMASSWDGGARLYHDVEFCKKHLVQGGRLLDLGAGSCTLSHQLLDHCREATAVEKVPGLLKMAPFSSKLTTFCSDLSEFDSDKSFDTILLFGVVNYLQPEEEIGLYEKCNRLLSVNGVLIVKNQCGVEREVVVDKYSVEIGADYHARYPSFQDQLNYLRLFFRVECYDIYPSACNPWPDTHFYGFVCRPCLMRSGKK